MARHVGLSKSTVHRWFELFGPHLRKTLKLSTDPFFVEKVRDIVGLYLNPPEHAGDLPICASAEVVREKGEFERFSTCVLNAYLTPVIVAYLDALAGELGAQGVAAPVSIMGSNGGAMTLERAAGFAAGTFLSGPVGGGGGAVEVCRIAGVDDCITFDMGGTSTDVALIHRLEPRISHANQIDAYPLQIPQSDIHTIGAGGGSIAWIQPDGTRDAGPRSAGAVPGPACYRKGGSTTRCWTPTFSKCGSSAGIWPTVHELGFDGSARPPRSAIVAQAFRETPGESGMSGSVEISHRRFFRYVASPRRPGRGRRI